MTSAHRVSWLSAGMEQLPNDDSWMDEAEAARIGSMQYAKRRMESTLSRHTAKTTVAQALQLDQGARSLNRVTIRNAADGAPEAYLDGDYFTPAEQRVAASFSGVERHLRANLIWSAKESALKVQRTGLRVDTRSVEVRLDPDRDGSGWVRLEVRSRDAIMPGWWRRFNEFVLTVVAAEPTAEPESLVDPPPLARATPSHRWLDQPRTAG